MEDQHDQPLPEEQEPEVDPIERAREIYESAEQANQRVERLVAQVGNS